MHRLSKFENGEWSAHSHPAVFRLPGAGESRRILAGAPGSDPAILGGLVDCLEEPFALLYVLHTPRGEALPGRYQSPPLTRAQVHAFLGEFANFLSADARFDLWVRSDTDKATLVWDRHDQVFAYGPLDRFEAGLRAMGFSPGDIAIPSPHAHHYQAALDPKAKQLMQSLEWIYAPLQPSDEQ